MIIRIRPDALGEKGKTKPRAAGRLICEVEQKERERANGNVADKKIFSHKTACEIRRVRKAAEKRSSSFSTFDVMRCHTPASPFAAL